MSSNNCNWNVDPAKTEKIKVQTKSVNIFKLKSKKKVKKNQLTSGNRVWYLECGDQIRQLSN